MFAKAVLGALLVALSTAPAYGAQVIVINGDPPGTGFNDPTPAVPVGGNPGTTVGQQALNVFQRAADVWGQTLVSDQPILVISFFMALPCTPTSGVLGAAGAYWYFAEIPPAIGGKALAAQTWYPAALAEKITRQNIVVDPDEPFELIAYFNNQLGQPGCLQSSGWYYGLDNEQPSNRIDLLAVVLHEFGHGLGFSVGPTNSNTGIRAAGLPSVWEQFMLDLSTGKRWLDMTTAERAASARNNYNLVWTGQKATNVVPSVLDFRGEVAAVDPSIGTFEALPAAFGAPLTSRMIGTLVAPADGGVDPYDGCEAFPAGSGTAGNFVLVNRGTCNFTLKAINAQNAGAIGAIIANNAPGLQTPGGSDPNVMIPVVAISQTAGAALRAVTMPLVNVHWNPLIRAGTEMNYPRLYAPLTFASGSSVSHWDVTATPSLLMEPSITPDLTSRVKNPEDLTRGVFFDIGW